MKIPLNIVQFASDIKGPGDPQRRHVGTTFAVGQKHYPILIEYDTETRLVTLLCPDAPVKDTVLVPAEHVVQMEPMAKSAKKVA